MTKTKMERIENAKIRAIEMKQTWIDIDVARLYRLTKKDLEQAVAEGILKVGYIKRCKAPKWVWEVVKVYRWE